MKKESEQAQNAESAAQLWDVSMLLTGCKQNGRRIQSLPHLSLEVEQDCYELKNPYMKYEVKPLEAPDGLKIENR